MGSKGVRPSTVAKIEAALRELHGENPDNFRLNLSELERKSGISRAALYSKSVKPIIDSFLKEHESITNYNKSRQELLKENKRLREENKVLEDQNRTLLTQYAELFSRIYGASVPGQLLLPELKASVTAEH